MSLKEEKNSSDESEDNKDDVLKKSNTKTGLRKKSRVFLHRQFRLIVRNLSYKINDDLLKKQFNQYGNIEEVNILKRPDGRLVGCAFVQYASKEEADKAIAESNGQIFMGRKITVDYSVDKNSYSKIKVKKEELKEEIKEESDVEEIQEEDEEDDEEEEEEEEEKPEPNRKKPKLDDTSEGKTVFMKNIPFETEEQELSEVLSRFGKIENVHINREKYSRHSRGTAFIKFEVKESAGMCIKQSQKLRIGNQVVEMIEALARKDIKDKEKLIKEKQAKDTRNLYLLKEGLIMAGSEASKNVSHSDMAQRLRLEQRNAQSLKNLNRFLSKERLTIHNIPESYGNVELRDMVKTQTGHNPKECRVMRENRPAFGNPSGRSKGFGFLSFNKHEIALSVLRKLNNNPGVFGKSNRPIVGFSIEDKNVHNIKEQRLQKSLLNNPTYQTKLEKIKTKNVDRLRKKKEARKAAVDNLTPTFSLSSEKAKKMKKPSKKERQRDIEKDASEYTGEISKLGKVGIRSNRKITHQANQHFDRLKSEKKAQKRIRTQKEHEKLRNERAQNAVKPRKKSDFVDVNKEENIMKATIGKYKNIINHLSEGSKRSKWYIE